MDAGMERYVMFADELDVSSLDIELRSVSLFALGRHFVVRRVEKLKTKSAKALASVLEKPLPEGTYLTLVAGSLRTTSVILKAAKGLNAVTTHATPKGATLQRLARGLIQDSGLDIPSPVGQLLLSECGNDLLSLKRELDKLRAWPGSQPMNIQTARELCFNHSETTVYPFYDRVGEGRLSAALDELEGLRDDPGRIVGGIIRHLSRLVMIRVLLDHRKAQPDIVSMTGLQDWLCRRLIAQAKKRSTETLTRALRLGVKLDQRIKQGRVAPNDALMQLLLSATAS